jgi:hypothetical protein
VASGSLFEEEEEKRHVGRVEVNGNEEGKRGATNSRRWGRWRRRARRLFESRRSRCEGKGTMEKKIDECPWKGRRGSEKEGKGREKEGREEEIESRGRTVGSEESLDKSRGFGEVLGLILVRSEARWRKEENQRDWTDIWIQCSGRWGRSEMVAKKARIGADVKGRTVR